MRVFGKALPPNAATLLGTNIVLLGVILPLLLAKHAWPSTLSAAGALSEVGMFVRLMAVGLLSQLMFYYYELYNLQLVRNLTEQLWRLLSAIGMSMLILAGVFAIAPGLNPGRDALLGLAPSLILVVVVSRLVVVPSRRTRVVIIGEEASCDVVEKEIECRSEWNMDLVGRFAADEMPSTELATQCDHIIVCANSRQTPEMIDQLTELKMRGVRVEAASRFFEEAIGRVQVDEIRPEWFVFSSGFENGRDKRLIKRCFDLLLAMPILVITAPIMLLAAAVILIEGKGPILFCQDRVGLYGRVFRIIKFRTMVATPENDTPQWTSNNDKRITKVGQVMRTFRIDELPQLFNVLRGDMSLVGPRPEQPYFCTMLAQHIPYYHQRHTILPGLTGWAQVRYHYGATIEESKRKLEFDLFYVKHLSPWLDLAILMETLKVVLVGRGAK